jgi:hypothetical protein
VVAVVKKIPTLFVRDPDDLRYVTPQVTPGCEWVLTGEGVATRKYDGTSVLVSLRGLYARREVKPSKQAPPGFIREDHDSTTGKTVGWEPLEQSPFVKPFREAYDRDDRWTIGTYELCGPKINGNPEGYAQHVLILHRRAERYPAMNRPAGYEELANVMATLPWEGIVWHHPDGRMAKLKVKDFRR